ncbi:EAL domain-containing protein [Spiribacter halobius]|uniref:EAL domain-containing protein n=1 Tax=Sediminicurvatus halobius TaxID=2182432 RepID=UPI001304966B|nr:EAL domain-containing protein [Spiribacter halobius]UEX77918.1 EAL domain-containing protein [Spiribacter halobius]
MKGTAHSAAAIALVPRNLHSQSFVSRIIEAFDRASLAPGSIEVEITETAIIQDSRAMHRRLSQLKEAGATIALDDFGDGYTSVRHLTSLPIDRLKVDRSLVSRVGADRAKARIVSAIILMAKDLGLVTVAEGVEDKGTEAFLRQHDCDLVQGFLYSRPVESERVRQTPLAPRNTERSG